MNIYIVKTTYLETSEVALALFHHLKNAKDFIIETVTESELSDDTLDASDIECMLDETNAFVDEVSSVEYEIIPTAVQDEQ